MQTVNPQLMWWWCALLFVAMAMNVQAQAVYLKVQWVANNRGYRTVGQPSDNKQDQTYRRTETYKVSLVNMKTTSNDFTVVWQFFAKGNNLSPEKRLVYDPNRGKVLVDNHVIRENSAKLLVYDKGVKTISLQGEGSTSFEVKSLPLEADDTTYNNTNK